MSKAPSSPIAEAAALGCAIADPTLAPSLRLGWFHDERHHAIAEVIIELSAKGRPIDEISIVKRAGAHMVESVLRCVNSCPSPAGFDEWRADLETKARLRAAHHFHGAARARIEALPATASRDEERETLDAIEREFVGLSEDATGAIPDHGADESVDELLNVLERGSQPAHLRTGLPSLDRIIRLRPGQLVVVAARPSVGKSALAGRIAEDVLLRQEKRVGWFSLEMGRDEVFRRMASGLSGVPFEDFENPDESQQGAIVDALGKLKRAPLRICDKSGLTMTQIAGLARRWRVHFGIELLIVDYLGLVRSDGKSRSRYEATTEISQGMKALARDLGVTLILLCQLNRSAVGDAEDRPRLHHLRDSGAIEQDADIAALLHVTGFDGPNRQVTAFVEKQRSGPVGGAKLLLHGPCMRFESVSPIDPEDMP